MTHAASRRLLAATFLAAVAASHGAAAQDAPAPAPADAAPALVVELNALQPSDRGCRFTFITTNNLGAELTKAAFELVMFDTAGMVNRLTVVDFKDLPEGKTKVRQFDFPGVECAKVGRVLINDATECAGSGVDPKACIRNLKAQTRTEVVFGL